MNGDLEVLLTSRKQGSGYPTRSVYRAIFLGIQVAFLLMGCASYNARQSRIVRSEKAGEYVQQGKWLDAYSAIEYDLRSNDHELLEPAQTFVKRVPGFTDHVMVEIEQALTAISSPSEARVHQDMIRRLYDIPLFNRQRVSDLQTKLYERVAAANLNGTIPFLLSSSFNEFPVLTTPMHMRIIFERSVNGLVKQSQAGRYERYLLQKTLEYVNERGVDSEEYAFLGKRLPDMNLSISDLKGTVAQLYPKYIAQALGDLEVKIHLTTDPRKRLLEEDLATALQRKSPLIQMVRQPTPGALTITVSELQYEERQKPDRTETTVVDNSQVNVLAAVLAMPRGASFLYDYTEGGAEIRYAYEIQAIQDGRMVFEKLVRATIDKNYYQCTNMRVQNVFGGLSGASFYPNQQVESRCRGGSSRIDVSTLRNEVLRRLTTEISSIPDIAKTLERSG